MSIGSSRLSPVNLWGLSLSRESHLSQLSPLLPHDRVTKTGTLDHLLNLSERPWDFPGNSVGASSIPHTWQLGCLLQFSDPCAQDTLCTHTPT